MHSLNTFGLRVAALAVFSVALAPLALAVAPTPARLVAMEGQALDGSTISTLGQPFTDGNGKVGFVGSLADSRRFIWYNDGPIFFSDDALPDVLTGGEDTMGVGNAGEFIYSPSFNGEDAVFTSGGKLLAGGDPIAFLPGRFSTFNSRPTMLPNGTACWIGGSSTSPGGSSSNRHTFKATDVSDPNTIVAVLSGGDVVSGKTISTSTFPFGYWFSDNDLHHIQIVSVTGAGAADVHVYLDRALIIQEGQPTGGGDNWQTFDFAKVNNNGDYLFFGDTDAASSADEFIAYNGAIALREIDTVDGVALLNGSVRDVSISNGGKALHIWGFSLGNIEHLFYGDASNLPGSRRVLSTNDEIDTNADGLPDHQIFDFSASTSLAPGLDLADNGFAYVAVEFAGDVEAIIGVALGPASCAGDMNCDGVVNFADIDPFVAALGTPGGVGWLPACPWLNGDANGDLTVNFGDIDAFVALIGQNCP